MMPATNSTRRRLAYRRPVWAHKENDSVFFGQYCERLGRAVPAMISAAYSGSSRECFGRDEAIMGQLCNFVAKNQDDEFIANSYADLFDLTREQVLAALRALEDFFPGEVEE